jgi:tripartite-type tricarboxylate transporter receptor subunit TctC
MSHILGLQLARAAGIDLVHVGYRGSSPALVDVMAGHVPLMFDALPSSLPLLRAGKIKALGISTPARSPHLPQVPTFTELGFPALEGVPWLGLWVAVGEAPAEQARLRELALDVMSRGQMRGRLAQLGFEQGRPRTSAELRQALHAESVRVGGVLASIGFKPRADGVSRGGARSSEPRPAGNRWPARTQCRSRWWPSPAG